MKIVLMVQSGRKNMVEIIEDKRKLDPHDICVRCGHYRNDPYVGCNSWGKSWSKHRYFTRAGYLVDENILMYAFRYALGRRTGAVLDVVGILKTYWQFLNESLKMQIQHEINEAIRLDRAGMECDIKNWRSILELKI